MTSFEYANQKYVKVLSHNVQRKTRRSKYLTKHFDLNFRQQNHHAE